MVTINIAFHSNPRGPGFWKLNTSFLTEKDYATQIRTVITQVHEEYKNDDNVNDPLLWEMMKLKIREKSMQYAAANKAKMSRTEGLISAIKSVKKITREQPLNNQIIQSSKPF